MPHQSPAVPSVSNFVSDHKTLISARLINAMHILPSVPTFAFRPSLLHCTLKTIKPANSTNGLMYSGSSGKRNIVAKSQHQAGLLCRFFTASINSQSPMKKCAACAALCFAVAIVKMSTSHNTTNIRAFQQKYFPVVKIS